MPSELIDSLNRQLLEQFENQGTTSAATEERIPAARYTCPDRFELERQQIFRQTPQPIAFSAELPGPGSFLALQVLDTPVLLTRDDAGVLHAFFNRCRHRGARLADGAGSQRRLVCPFHGWTYGLDGQLSGRPGDEFFTTPPEDCGLMTLPVSETQGIIVIALDSAVHQTKVDEALDEIATQLSTFELANCEPLGRQSLDVKANWKLVNDLSLESYHFAVLHRDSVAQLLTDNAIVETYDRSSRWAFPLKSIARLAQLPSADWPEHIEGSVTYTVFPGVMLIINASGAQMIRSEPGTTPGTSRVSYIGIARAGTELSAAKQAYEFGGSVFTGEDLPMAENCQQGLAASGGDLLLGRNEVLLQFWHRLWDEAISPKPD